MLLTAKIHYLDVKGDYGTVLVKVYAGDVTTEQEYGLNAEGDVDYIDVTRFRAPTLVAEKTFTFTRQFVVDTLKTYNKLDDVKELEFTTMEQKVRFIKFFIRKYVEQRLAQEAADRKLQVYVPS